LGKDSLQPGLLGARLCNPSSERGYYDVAYKDFIEPDGRIYFAGDHCSHLNAWMEGAALAAHRAAKMIAERVRG
jgi:monoamine oxidase